MLLGVLAALAVIAVVAGGDDGDDGDDGSAGGGTTSTVAVAPDAPVSDEELAATLLPPVGALGPDWIETQREDAAQEAEVLPAGGCVNFPIPQGFVIHGEHQHTRGTDLVEALSVTAGVVAEGVEAPSLRDDVVVGCLLDVLRGTLAEGATAEVADDVAIGPLPPGALVSHLRVVVTGQPPVSGTFDFVLVQRDRLVSLGLLQGIDPDVTTPVRAVVEALDGPLQAALPLVG